MNLRVRRYSVAALWASGLLAGALSWGPVRDVASAATLLDALSSKGRPPPDVGTSALIVDEDGVRFRAKFYRPAGAVRRCAVIGHGVQWKGIDEPRLVRFASELAARGVAVLTPELLDLTDYRVTRRGADVLSVAARSLSRRCGGIRVGLLGFSFAGGLVLLAAGDRAVSDHLRYVAGVGGYEDLSRVLHFLLTDVVEAPGGPITRKAHEYGLVILVYEHLDAFVPEDDLPTIHDAVRAWLTEDRERAWALASRRTTEAGERLFLELAGARLSAFREKLAPLMLGQTAEERALSPSGALAKIPVPVYLLHGEGDTVIPPEETLWADLELADRPHRALVTPLIEHVEINGQPTFRDRWNLVQFMARLL